MVILIAQMVENDISLYTETMPDEPLSRQSHQDSGRPDHKIELKAITQNIYLSLLAFRTLSPSLNFRHFKL